MYVTLYFNVCHPAQLLQQTSSSKPFWMRKGSVSMTQVQLTRDVYVNVQFKDLDNLDDLNATMQFGPQCTYPGRLSKCNSQLDTTTNQ